MSKPEWVRTLERIAHGLEVRKGMPHISEAHLKLFISQLRDIAAMNLGPLEASGICETCESEAVKRAETAERKLRLATRLLEVERKASRQSLDEHHCDSYVRMSETDCPCNECALEDPHVDITACRADVLARDDRSCDYPEWHRRTAENTPCRTCGALPTWDSLRPRNPLFCATCVGGHVMLADEWIRRNQQERQ